MSRATRGAVVEVKCARCKQPFTARVADRKRGWGKFCSKSCKAIKQTYGSQSFPASPIEKYKTPLVRLIERKEAMPCVDQDAGYEEADADEAQP